LEAFKKELKDDQQDVVEKAAKRARTEGSLQFRSKRNEDQYHFNSRMGDIFELVGSHLKRAEEVISALPSAASTSAGESSSTPIGADLSEHLQKAKDAMNEGTQLVSQQQKHIRLADRSEFGWKFVKEYASDDLADNDEDEKRIAKAEKSAEKKASVNKKKKATAHSAVSQSTSSRLPFNRSSSIWYPAVTTGMSRPYGGWGVRSRLLPASGPRFPATPPSGRHSGPCFHQADISGPSVSYSLL
jgi:hypothetical protein